MSNTRINSDDCRTKKYLQQSTDPGRYMLNVPGNGDKLCYIADPHIRIQKWGGNLRTNDLGLEDELRGLNRRNHKDCIDLDNYKSKKNQVISEPVTYPTCYKLSTEQSRAIMPVWTARELEQSLQSYLPIDPQINVCLPFYSNLNTRIMEKDAFIPINTCPNNNVI